MQNVSVIYHVCMVVLETISTSDTFQTCREIYIKTKELKKSTKQSNTQLICNFFIVLIFSL